jgi:hypothetical protein
MFLNFLIQMTYRGRPCGSSTPNGKCSASASIQQCRRSCRRLFGKRSVEMLLQVFRVLNHLMLFRATNHQLMLFRVPNHLMLFHVVAKIIVLVIINNVNHRLPPRSWIMFRENKATLLGALQVAITNFF